MRSNSPEAALKYNMYRKKPILCCSIRELINKKKNSRSSSRFYINNVCTIDKQIIAVGFNSYFVNIGPTLANIIPETNQSPIDDMGTCNLNSMFIEPVTENEVQSLIRNLKHSNTGWDSISAAVLKSADRTILKPHILFKSLAHHRGFSQRDENRSCYSSLEIWGSRDVK